MSDAEGPAESPADAAAVGSSAGPVRFPVSGIIICLYMLGFGLLEAYWGGFAQVLYRMGVSNGAALSAGDWQRPILAGWLHLTREHAIANMFGVVMLTMAAEWTLGVAPACVVTVVGSITGFLLESWLFPDARGIGISGGVWALAGASFSIGAVEYLYDRDKQRLEWAGAGVLLGLLFVGQEAFFLWDPKASLTGHLGGFAAGIPLGAAFALMPRTLWSQLLQGVAGFGVMALPLVAAATLWPQTEPWGTNVPEDSHEICADSEQPAYHLCVPLPDSLAASSEQWIDDDGCLHLQAGRATRDVITVSIYAAPLAAGESIWTTTGDEHERLRGVPRPVSVGGHSFAFYDFVLNKAPEFERPRWIGVVNGVCIDLRITMQAEVSPAWRDLAAQLVGQIRIEWPATTPRAAPESGAPLAP